MTVVPRPVFEVTSSRNTHRIRFEVGKAEFVSYQVYSDMKEANAAKKDWARKFDARAKRIESGIDTPYFIASQCREFADEFKFFRL